ncbi:hypothetical protein WJX81_002018 [Elliptochloris bilobata]|uniref:DUF4336 domain-containing protein n=1 Tax=Elliptochloris bilobata TaxID=381761 RepID=A0AAW1S0B1_9CHLO
MPVATNVWAADRPFIWNKIDVGGRMAVLRLKDGTLLVHSPVVLDNALVDALARLGPVGHIVSPNYEHVKYAEQWQKRYPEAKAYACPGLKAREPGIFGAAVELRGRDAPAEWQGEVEPLHLSYEANPFTGKPFFNEVVLFFRPARLLVTSDLFWNYPSVAPGGTKLWKFGMDQVYLRFYRSFMIKDKGAYEAAMQTLLQDWDWEAILPCHGDAVISGGKALLRRHLGRT